MATEPHDAAHPDRRPKPGARSPEPGARRLFIAVPVATTVAEQLAGACESLARRAQAQGVPMRWIAPASYHVTLKFLGWTRAEAIPAITAALERAAATVEPFRWKAARLGAFPSTSRASVVWAGVEDATELTRLAAAVEDELEQLGFPRERRRFHAHVTIARLREPRDVADVLLPLSEQVFSMTRVDSVHLVESLTKPKGSEYVSIARRPLGGPENGRIRQSDPVQPASFDTSPGTDDGWDRHS